mgnify:CR=1 FL=1
MMGQTSLCEWSQDQMIETSYLYCQTPIPVQTWELTLLSPGNNNNNKNKNKKKNLTQILEEGAKL